MPGVTFDNDKEVRERNRSRRKASIATQNAALSFAEFDKDGDRQRTPAEQALSVSDSACPLTRVDVRSRLVNRSRL